MERSPAWHAFQHARRRAPVRRAHERACPDARSVRANALRKAVMRRGGRVARCVPNTPRRAMRASSSRRAFASFLHPRRVMIPLGGVIESYWRARELVKGGAFPQAHVAAGSTGRLGRPRGCPGGAGRTAIQETAG